MDPTAAFLGRQPLHFSTAVYTCLLLKNVTTIHVSDAK